MEQSRQTQQPHLYSNRLHLKSMSKTRDDYHCGKKKWLSRDTECVSSDEGEDWPESNEAPSPALSEMEATVNVPGCDLCWTLDDIRTQCIDAVFSDRLSPTRGEEGRDALATLYTTAKTGAVPKQLDVPLVRTRVCSERVNWSSNEDAVIRAMILQHGNQWSRIAVELPGRTCAAVRNRWFRLHEEDMHTLGERRDQVPPSLDAFRGVNSAESILTASSNEDRSNWNKEEDEVVMNAYRKKRRTWRNIAQLLPGRTEHAIRNRLYRLTVHSQPSPSQGCWTTAEDKLIMTSVCEHGKKWTLIAQRMPNRTEDAIRNRYTRLHRAALKAAQ
eukprot:6197265-Pleurochrysis_carterae.AAC.3